MKTIIRTIAVLAATGMLSGACLSLVYRLSAPRAAEHRARELREAVLAVVPGGVGFTEVRHPAGDYYRVHDSEGRPAGFGVPGSGTGYGGEIVVMAGFSADLETITGVRVLENLETPGLGGRIGEASFEGGFAGLPLEDGPVLLGAPPGYAAGVEAITGATISSRAVVDIVNAALARLKETGEPDG